MDGKRVIAFFGLRTIKTGVAVALSVYLSMFIPHSLPLLAGVAAILCLQPTISAGIQVGFTRIKATLLGGLLGLVFHYLFGSHPLMMGVAVIIALRILNWLHWGEGIALASLTVIVIMSQAAGEVIPYVFGRVFSTLIGVVVAMAINILVAPPRHFVSFRSNLHNLTADFPGLYTKAIQAYGDNDLQLAREILLEMEKIEKGVALLRRELKQLPSAPTSYLLYLEGIDFQEYILYDRSIQFLRNATAKIRDLVEVIQRRYQRKQELLRAGKNTNPNGLSPQFQDLLQALYGLGAMLGELHGSVFRLVAAEEKEILPRIREQADKIGWYQEQVHTQLRCWEVELIRELDIFSLMSAHRVIFDLEGITEALMGLVRAAMRAAGQMLELEAEDENTLEKERIELYWENSGRENTLATVQAAVERARELGIDHIVVASNTGETAKLFLDQGVKVVCVSHHVGFREPGDDEMPREVREFFREKGIPVLTTSHLLSGIGRAISQKFGGLDLVQMVAQSLRMLGQGTKVCVEVTTMALDAGLIPYGREVIAVGGTSRGADTALVITPAHSRHFFDTKIHEIICKPR